MKTQQTNQDDASRPKSGAQAVPASGGQGSGDAGGKGDSQALVQAARAVMNPEIHEPEWRYFHGATHG
jgi:hypothetical protein